MHAVPKRTGSRPRLDYGRAIETLRASQGLGRKEVARLARISSSYLREVELGLKRPSTDIVARIARAFGMKGSAFLQYVEEVSAPPPEEEKPVPPTQLPLKRSRSLALFSSDQAQGSKQGALRGRRGPGGQEEQGDLAVSELLVIARRLGVEDRVALLQLARHLLRRK